MLWFDFDPQRIYDDLKDNIPVNWMEYKGVIGTVGRIGVLLFAAYGFTWAKDITGDQAELWAYAGLALGAALWGIARKMINNVKSRRASIASSVLSAEATHVSGVPTTVVVQRDEVGITQKLNLEQIKLDKGI